MPDQEISLSVIVPVYNAVPWLEECIESILNQTYREFELLLVDDGSTDGSGVICHRYEAADGRVRVFNQENSGVTAARKKGLAYAGGRYVTFIDADDYIEPDYFAQLLQASGDCDLVTSGIIYEQKDQKKIEYDKIAQGRYTGREEMNHVLDNMIFYKLGPERGLTPYMCDKLYRTDYARRTMVALDESVFYGEDSEFLYRYILSCKSLHSTRICGYHYRLWEGSVSHSKHKGYLSNLNTFYLSLEEAFYGHERQERLMLQLQMWICRMLRGTSYIMNFSPEARATVNYLFPFYQKVKGGRILLYGAGRVGYDYYLQLRNRTDLCLAAWTDRETERYLARNYPILPVEEALKQSYDYVVIGVRREEVMAQIRRELTGRGVPAEKILWEEPECLVL